MELEFTNRRRPPPHPTEPVRRLRNTRQGMQLTMLWSQKCNRRVRCESSIEADYARFLEWDKNTVSYMEQPMQITIRLEGKAQQYVPDFWSLDRIGAQLITEIKPDHWVHSPKMVAKYREAKAELERRGYHFNVVTANDLRQGHLASNLKCLYPRVTEGTPYQTARIRELLAKNGGQMTVEEILATLGKDYLGAVFRHIYHHCKNISAHPVDIRFPVSLGKGD